MLQTDESPYLCDNDRASSIGDRMTINHSRTYGMGENHTNTVENAFAAKARRLRHVPQGFDKALGPLLQ